MTADTLSSDVMNRPWIGHEGQKQQFAKVFR